MMTSTLTSWDRLSNDLELENSYDLNNKELYDFITLYCMGVLSDKQYELFLMRYKHLLSNEEISRIKNIPIIKLEKIQKKIIAKVKNEFIRINNSKI